MSDQLAKIEREFETYLRGPAQLSAASAAAVLAICQPHQYAIGQNLVQQGAMSEHMHFVARGLLRYYLINLEGKEVNKSIRIAPCIAGSTVALVKQIPSALNICGFGAVTALNISWQPFCELMRTSHELERFYRRGVEANFIEHEQRELSLLMDGAEQRYVDYLESYSTVLDQIPLFHVASYIGITPVALSRIRKRLGMSAGTPD